jgi:hypothetical protein
MEAERRSEREQMTQELFIKQMHFVPPQKMSSLLTGIGGMLSEAKSPLKDWARLNQRDYTKQLLPEDLLIDWGYFNAKESSALWLFQPTLPSKEHQSGTNDNAVSSTSQTGHNSALPTTASPVIKRPATGPHLPAQEPKKAKLERQQLPDSASRQSGHE